MQANGFKIFKRDLSELVAEIPAPGPIYISNFRQTHGGEMPLATFQITVAAFNLKGHVCELVVSSGSIWIHDTEHCKKASERADANEKEIRARLNALAYDVRDGRISDTPVLGGVD